ncbi:hypothetical protein N7G274_005169 [Stereocaulon virgatum]|uniref:Uncharacterized protein n=1 Tax=Stereocaulon virgatum TaxID=373712 RepID=A0ABR4A988_9LECA
MASETRPRRRRDSLGPNPFRLGPRAQREVAKEEAAARSPSSPSTNSSIMASETRPRRRRDSLGPNPFRLGPRAQREVAKEEAAARSPSSPSAPSLPTAPQAVPAPILQAPLAAIEPPPAQEDRDPIQRSLSSYSNSEAILGTLVAGPRLHALPPESLNSQAVVAPQATPAPLYQASARSSRPQRAKKNHGPSLLNPSSSIDDEKATPSPTWFLPYPSPSSVPTSVLEGLVRSGYPLKCPFLNAFPLHPRLKRELQLEQDRRSQVWLSSPLGRLPTEIRVMIYEHVLIAPPSQSPITIRELSEEKQVDRFKAFAKPSSRKVSPVAILQTCRLIY